MYPNKNRSALVFLNQECEFQGPFIKQSAPLPESLATEPHPAVDEPEGHGDGVDDHFPLCPLLVLLLQKLESPVQLDDLHDRPSIKARPNLPSWRRQWALQYAQPRQKKCA